MRKVICVGKISKRGGEEEEELIIDLSAIETPFDLKVKIKEGFVGKITCIGQPKVHIWHSVAKLELDCRDYNVEITFDEDITF